MKLPEWGKYIWWFLSILFIGALVFFRRELIFSDNPSVSTFDLGIVAVLIALILTPLTSEFSIFGMTIKQKLDQTNTELKHFLGTQLIQIRSDIYNSVINENKQHQETNVFVSDRRLEKTKEEIKSSVNAYLQGADANLVDEEFTSEKSENALMAFKSHYLLEKELKRIWEENYGKSPREGLGLTAIVSMLSEDNFLIRDLEYPLRDVIAVANSAIHGEPLSKKRADFLDEVTPYLLKKLQSI